MRVILFAFMVMAMALAAPVHAQDAQTPPQDDWAIGEHLVSWHSNPKGCYPLKACNDFNPGLSITWDGWLGGAYYNSLKRLTVYAGRSFVLAQAGPVTALVGGVLATGYRITPFVPVITPAVAVTLSRHWRAQVLWIPRVGTINPTNVLHLMLVETF